jgi:hypothetical protein
MKRRLTIGVRGLLLLALAGCSTLSTGTKLPNSEKLSGPDCQLQAHDFYLKAIEKYESENYEAAEALINNGLRCVPNDPDLRILQGKLRLKTKNYDPIICFPSSPPPSVVIGEPLKLRINDPGKHMKEVKEVFIKVAVNPGGDMETVVLRKSGPEQALYRADIVTTNGAVKPMDGIIQIKAGDSISASLTKAQQKQFDINWSPVIITVKEPEIK